jgi:hypothetical protein
MAHALDDLQDRLHHLGRRHQRRRVLAKKLVLALEPLAAAEGPAELDLGPEDAEQPRVVPGLLDEIPRSRAHRLDGELDAPPGGHDHDGESVVHVRGCRRRSSLAARGGVARRS